MQVLSAGITKIIVLLVTFIIPCNVHQKTIIQRVTFTVILKAVYMQSKYSVPWLLCEEIEQGTIAWRKGFTGQGPSVWQTLSELSHFPKLGSSISNRDILMSATKWIALLIIELAPHHFTLLNCFSSLYLCFIYVQDWIQSCAHVKQWAYF